MSTSESGRPTGPRKRILIIAILAVFIIGGLLTWAISSNLVNKNSAPGPNHSTLIPAGKDIEDLGGWNRISPPSGEPVFAFIDELDGVPIKVSQQPLPESFRKDTSGSLASLAKSYNASTKLDAGGTTVFIGTNAKGPQSVIFIKNDLLIMITSEGMIGSGTWLDYVRSLTVRD